MLPTKEESSYNGLSESSEVWAREFCYGEPRPWGELVILGLVCGGLTGAVSYNMLHYYCCFTHSIPADGCPATWIHWLPQRLVGWGVCSGIGAARFTWMSSRVSDCLPLPVSGEWPLLLRFPGGADDVFPPLPRFPRPRGAIVLVSSLPD